MNSTSFTRRQIVGAATGAAGISLIGPGAFAQQLPMPKSPLEISVLDGAGGLALAQPILDNYSKLKPQEVPLTECLKDTVDRVIPFWIDVMAPAIKAGNRIVVAAHGNSIRALIKYLDQVSDEAIVNLNIPNGIPLVYELDANLKPIQHYYLGDAAAAAKAAAAVANQGKA